MHVKQNPRVVSKQVIFVSGLKYNNRPYFGPFGATWNNFQAHSLMCDARERLLDFDRQTHAFRLALVCEHEMKQNKVLHFLV